MRHLVSIVIGGAAALWLACAGASAADDSAKHAALEAGKTSLPVPRFVSLKSDKVNVRKGPATDQSIVWVFSRAGLPVEVIAESDNWRRVRDSEGADGWVFHSLLSARRTVLITPWSKDQTSVPLYSSASTSSRAVASLQAGVLGNVRELRWRVVRAVGRRLFGLRPAGPALGRLQGRRDQVTGFPRRQLFGAAVCSKTQPPSCPALRRASTTFLPAKDVVGRDKPGHDEFWG